MDLALVVARAAYLAGTMSLAGALAFRLLVAPFPLARLVWSSLAMALAAGAVWLLLQSTALAGASDLAGAVAAVPIVLSQTLFGHVFLIRLALLLPAGVLAGCMASRGWLLLAGLGAAGVVGLQAAIGHAAASGNPLLVASMTLHLLAVAAWLGGLVPLWLALRGAAPGRVARRYSLWALLAVAVIVATGLEQAALLIGSFSALLDTEYGRIALVKIGLLLALLCVAATNRFVFTPALDRAPTQQRRLHVSLAVEIALGLCVITAAATLAAQAPPTDMPAGMPMDDQGSN